MDALDDPKLDALLREAAPRGAPAGFADAVLARARARQRRGRFVHLAAAAAAMLALALGATLWPERPTPSPLGRGRGEGPQGGRGPHSQAPHPTLSQRERELGEAGGRQPEAPAPAFAAVVPSRGDSTHSVMMARFEGKFVIFARPRAAEADEDGPSPRASGGWTTID
ncbi:MAG: hypothetical protein FJ291_11240 [Planctomycetes bacterium]|nr:hypothetical protein [Planctomycetota bacterium]